MSTQPNAEALRSPQPRIRCQNQRICVEVPEGGEVDLLHSSIHRSKLLRQVCENESPWEAPLAIDTQALQQWLHHVQPGHSLLDCIPELSTTATPSRGKAPSEVDFPELPAQVMEHVALSYRAHNTTTHGVRRQSARLAKKRDQAESAAGTPTTPCAGSSTQRPPKRTRLAICDQADELSRLCTLLQVADILIDEETEVEACAAIATLLEAQCDAGKKPRRQPLLATQVLGTLPEGLGLKVLRALHRPLSPLLRYLSLTPFRPLLLRARHPSIDAAASLHLTGVNPPDLPLVLTPIATLTHLQDLSLSGNPLVKFHEARAGQPVRTLEQMLLALPRLTSLCLRNTTLRACADSLAAALPGLPHLAALDACGNRLDGEIDAFAAALPSAAGLRTLLLNNVASTPHALCALASALYQMPNLERLSIGKSGVVGAHGTTAAGQQHIGAPDLVAVLAPLRSMEALSALDFTYVITAKAAAPVCAAVADLTQLRSLRLDCLNLCDTPTSLAPLRRLTSLNLVSAISYSNGRGVGDDGEDPAAPVLKRMLASLSSLTALQMLQLPRTHEHAETCSDILSTLQKLTHLSRVTLPQSTICEVPQAVRDLTVSLATMPHMQCISLPMLINCWDEAPVGAWPDAEGAEALNDIVRVSSEKTVELCFACVCLPDIPMDATARQALSDVLPLSKSMTLLGMGSVLVDLFCSGAERLTALTKLRLSMERPERVQTAATRAHRLVRGLGLLSGLQALALTWSVTDAAQARAELCGYLPQLLRLTSLVFEARGPDHDLVPQVLASCRALPLLQDMKVGLLEPPVGWNGQVVGRAPYWWAEAGRPTGWDVSGLLSVRTLMVCNHGNLEADKVFWQSLKLLSRLQCLHVEDYVGDGHLRTLAEQAQRRGVLSLRDLRVWDHQSTQKDRRRRATLVHSIAGERLWFDQGDY